MNAHTINIYCENGCTENHKINSENGIRKSEEEMVGKELEQSAQWSCICTKCLFIRYLCC